MYHFKRVLLKTTFQKINVSNIKYSFNQQSAIIKSDELKFLGDDNLLSAYIN